MHTTEISYPFQTKSFKQLVIQSKKMLQHTEGWILKKNPILIHKPNTAFLKKLLTEIQGVKVRLLSCKIQGVRILSGALVLVVLINVKWDSC